MRIISRLHTVVVIFIIFQSISCYATEVSDPEPSTPPFWELFTLYGVDSDKDGVRDDVEIWIKKEVDDTNLRKALSMLAIHYNNFILNSFNSKAYKTTNKKVVRLNNCVQKLLAFKPTSETNLFGEFQRKYFNTVYRELMQWLGDAQLNDEERWEKNASLEYSLAGCGFRLHRLDLIFEKMEEYQNSEVNRLSPEEKKRLLEKYGEN